MASAAPAPQLPLLYEDLRPLSSVEHSGYRLQRREGAPFLTSVHAVPVTIDEFVIAGRSLPIIFSSGEKSIPLALMGLNAGVNVFIDDDGKLTEQNVYLPAYIRRYPFMLAKLQPDSEEMSLCFDPTSDVIGDFDEGELMFEGSQPSQTTKDILAFCEQFETAAVRTGQFVEQIEAAGLMMDGEFTISPDNEDKPFIYRGFKMVNEEKLKELDGDKLKEFLKNGILPLMYAHLMSMSLVRDVFSRQLAQGKMPKPDAQVQQPDA